MQKREIAKLFKDYPEILSVSIRVKKFPKYAEDDMPGCKIVVFPHGKNDFAEYHSATFHKRP